MAEVQSQVVVARSADAVFAFLADLANDPAWRAEVRSVALTGGTAGEPGATYRQTLDVSGREVVIEVELVRIEPGRLVAYRVSGPVAAQGGYRMAAEGDGTRVTFTAEFRSPGLRRLLDGPVAAAVGRAAGANLERLRVLMESS